MSCGALSDSAFIAFIWTRYAVCLEFSWCICFSLAAVRATCLTKQPQPARGLCGEVTSRKFARLLSTNGKQPS